MSRRTFASRAWQATLEDDAATAGALGDTPLGGAAAGGRDEGSRVTPPDDDTAFAPDPAIEAFDGAIASAAAASAGNSPVAAANARAPGFSGAASEVVTPLPPSHEATGNGRRLAHSSSVTKLALSDALEGANNESGRAPRSTSPPPSLPPSRNAHSALVVAAAAPAVSLLRGMSSLPCSPLTAQPAGSGSDGMSASASFGPDAGSPAASGGVGSAAPRAAAGDARPHHSRYSSIAPIEGAPPQVAPVNGAVVASRLREMARPGAFGGADARNHHARVSSVGAELLTGASPEVNDTVTHFAHQRTESNAADSAVAGGGSKLSSPSPPPGENGASTVAQQQQASPLPTQAASAPRPWRKILYEQQDYDDNYVDATFMRQLHVNAELRDLTVPGIVRESLVIVQQLSIVVVFCFLYISCQNRSVSLWQVALLDSVLFVCGIVVVLVTQGRLGAVNYTGLKGTILSSFVLASWMVVAAPVLYTLTRNFADDTIYALSMTLAFVHVVFADYDFMNNSDAFRGGKRAAATAAANALVASTGSASTAAVAGGAPLGALAVGKSGGAAASLTAAAAMSSHPAPAAGASPAIVPGAPASLGGADAQTVRTTGQSAGTASTLHVASSTPPAASTAAPIGSPSTRAGAVAHTDDDTASATPSAARFVNVEHNASMTAAVVGTVLLASRLHDPRFTAVLLLFGVECFSLSPAVRRSLRSVSEEVHAGFSLALCGVAVGCLMVTHAVAGCAFLIVVALVSVVWPFTFVRAQDPRFKTQIRGPWDEAVPKNSAAAREWANTV
jgi:hypothetical protein